jgi:hypothetical protein
MIGGMKICLPLSNGVLLFYGGCFPISSQKESVYRLNFPKSFIHLGVKPPCLSTRGCKPFLFRLLLEWVFALAVCQKNGEQA